MSTDDRDDQLLDRLAAGVAPADDAEAAARAPYERLVERLRAVDAPAGSAERIAARLRREQAHAARRRWWWLGGGLALAAASVAALVVLRPRPTPPPRGLEVAIVAPAGEPRRGDAAVGDTLRLRVSDPRAHVELRVYRDGALQLRCPGAPPCAGDPQHPRADLTVADAGVYRVVVLAAAAPLPPPGAGGLDADLLAARTASVSITLHEPLVIQH